MKEPQRENARLKRMLADEMLGNEQLKEALGKKVMSPGHKRQIVEEFVAPGRCSGRAACRHFSLHCSTFAYEAKQPDASLARLKAALRRVSNQHPEMGYPKNYQVTQGRRLENLHTHGATPTPRTRSGCSGQEAEEVPSRSLYRAAD